MTPGPSQVIIRLVAACAGGAAIAFAFPPLSFWPGVFVGAASILIAVAGAGLRLALLLGFAAGITGHAVAFVWLWSVLSRFTQASAPATSAYVAAFIVYHAAQLALFAAFVSRRGRQGRFVPVRSTEAAAAWVILEWCFPKIFPWSLADGLGNAAVLRQAADIAGPHGLSFMIVATSAALVEACDAQAPWQRRWRTIMTVGIALSAMALYGAARISQFAGERSIPTLHVTIVQGGVGLHDDPQVQTELAWQTYEPLTLAAVNDPGVGGLIIWPETILRAYVRHDEEQLLRVRRLVSRLDHPLLFGALDRPPAGAGELNVATLLLPEAGVGAPPLQVYRKRWLLPFAEYVPGADLIGHLRAWRTTGHFVPGEVGGPLDLGTGATLAPAICFEALRPGAFNLLVRAGASLLVNLSDDNWFAATAAPQQHLQSAAMRAVETRRWLVRSSDSGISAVVDPTGTITQQLDVGVVGSLQADVPLERGRTLYVRLGDWTIPVCILLLAARWRQDWLARRWQRSSIRRRA